MSKVLPKAIQERPSLNLRQGIKSSLNNWKQLLASLYLFFLYVRAGGDGTYCKEKLVSTRTVLDLSDSFAEWLNLHWGSVPSVNTRIGGSPLYLAQIEHLQVGLELFLKLAKVRFVDTGRPDSSERTGGNRYCKELLFSTNMKLFADLISQHAPDDVAKFLDKWLSNTDDSLIGDKAKDLLVNFTEECQYKIRTNSGEIFFQQEGVYDRLRNPVDTVESSDAHEPVGPFRILKSYIKEGMHPYLTDDSADGFKRNKPIDEFASYADMVKTSLSLIPKRTTVYQEIEPLPLRREGRPQGVPYQRITYGAPGAGKSYRVDGLCDCQDVVKCFRTTFHPDSDYSTFVGAYKPTMVGEKIAYEFRPQAFMDAYVEAWKAMVQPDDGEVKNVVLVIEEINRGNCAQIFGDLFQLLDRGNGGYSTYPIDADNDIAIWLAKQFGNTLDGLAKPDEIRRQDDWTDVLTCKKLALPPNLYIWATMNTSDQSLFPIDSAFKRRWDWEYVPIAKPDKSGDANWKERKIEVGDALFDWWDFLSAINGHIAKATESEDKQLGYFFVKADDATGYISAKQFANKVLFYLFGDVFKSYELPKKDCFQLANNTVLAFRDFFYNEKVKEGDGASQVTREPGDVKLETVAAFLRNLKWDGKGVNEGTKDQTDGSQGEH